MRFVHLKWGGSNDAKFNSPPDGGGGDKILYWESLFFIADFDSAGENTLILFMYHIYLCFLCTFFTQMLLPVGSFRFI